MSILAIESTIGRFDEAAKLIESRGYAARQVPQDWLYTAWDQLFQGIGSVLIDGQCEPELVETVLWYAASNGISCVLWLEPGWEMDPPYPRYLGDKRRLDTIVACERTLQRLPRYANTGGWCDAVILPAVLSRTLLSDKSQWPPRGGEAISLTWRFQAKEIVATDIERGGWWLMDERGRVIRHKTKRAVSERSLAATLAANYALEGVTPGNPGQSQAR